MKKNTYKAIIYSGILITGIALILLIIKYSLPTTKEIQIEPQNIQEQKESYSISITSPQSGFSFLDDQIKTHIEQNIQTFKQTVQELETIKEYKSKSGLYIQYESYIYKNKIIFIVLSEYEYSGGAHGNTTFTNFIYDTQKNKILSFDDIFHTSEENINTLYIKIKAALIEQLTRNCGHIFLKTS